MGAIGGSYNALELVHSHEKDVRITVLSFHSSFFSDVGTTVLFYFKKYNKNTLVIVSVIFTSLWPFTQTMLGSAGMATVALEEDDVDDSSVVKSFYLLLE